MSELYVKMSDVENSINLAIKLFEIDDEQESICDGIYNAIKELRENAIDLSYDLVMPVIPEEFTERLNK